MAFDNTNIFDFNQTQQVTPTSQPSFNAPQQTNTIQDFLNNTKGDTNFTKKRNAVIQMLQNEEDESFIQDTIVNKMLYTAPTINDLSLGAEASQRLSNLGTKLGERVSEVGESFARPKTQAGQGLGTALKTVGSVIGGGFDIGFEGIAFLTPDVVKEKLAGGAKSLWNMLSPDAQNTTVEALKAGGEIYAQFKQENPFLADAVEGVGNIAAITPIGPGAKAVQIGVKKVIPKITQTGKDIISPVIKGTKKVIKQVPEQIEKGTEKVAGRVLGSSDGKKELFQAASPSFATLGKDKNIVNIGKNVEKADQTVLKYGHTPTNTETRALAYKDSMKQVWDQVDKARGGTPTKVNAKVFANEIEKFIDTKKISGKVNPEHLSDIKALQAQADYYRSLGKVNVPTLGQIRADLNAMTSFKSQNPFGDVYNTGLKNIGKLIRTTENNLIESYKGTKFGGLMQEYRALAEIYPDIIKANIKNMRRKGASFEESFSRISGIGDVLKGTLDIFTKGQQGIGEVAKGLGKVALGKVYGKLKDPDFLVQEGYRKLKQALKPKTIKNVRSNVSANIPSVIKPSKKPTKVSRQKQIIKPKALNPTTKKVTKPKILSKITKNLIQKMSSITELKKLLIKIKASKIDNKAELIKEIEKRILSLKANK